MKDHYTDSPNQNGSVFVVSIFYFVVPVNFWTRETLIIDFPYIPKHFHS